MPVADIILIMTVAFLGCVKGEEGPCEQFAFGCCPHTKWDYKEEICVDCKAGYYWINCSKTCPYPAFGHRCKQTCPCNQEMCDYRTGCIENDTLNHAQQSTKCNKNFKSTSKSKFIILMVLLSVLGVILMTYIVVLIIEKHIKITEEHRNQS